MILGNVQNEIGWPSRWPWVTRMTLGDLQDDLGWPSGWPSVTFRMTLGDIQDDFVWTSGWPLVTFWIRNLLYLRETWSRPHWTYLQKDKSKTVLDPSVPNHELSWSITSDMTCRSPLPCPLVDLWLWLDVVGCFSQGGFFIVGSCFPVVYKLLWSEHEFVFLYIFCPSCMSIPYSWDSNRPLEWPRHLRNLPNSTSIWHRSLCT